MSTSRDFLRNHVQQWFDPLVIFLEKHQVSAIQVTIVGLLLGMAGAPFIVIGWLGTGGWLFAAGALLDAVDGPLARRSTTESAYGAILDSSADRVSEGVVLIAIMVYLASQAQIVAVGLCGLTLLASQTTSYLRAVAEAKDIDCKIGWVTRVERVILVSTGLIFDQLFAVLAVLAITCTITSIQRFLHIRRSLVSGAAILEQPRG